MNPTSSGQRESLYLNWSGNTGSTYLVFGPHAIKIQKAKAKARRTLGNIRNVILRPYIPNGPLAVAKLRWTLDLDRAEGNNYWLLDGLDSEEGFVDFADFKPVGEKFAVPPSGTFAPISMRRPFISFVDSSLWPSPGGSIISARYATTDYPVVSGIVTPGTPTVASVDVFGQVTFTPSATPDQGSTYRHRQTPLYLVESDRDGDRSEPFMSKSQLTLEEC